MFSGFWDAKTARVLSTILIFAMVLAFLRGARDTLTLFLFAILFAYFVEPLVAFFQRRLRGRVRGIVASYLVFWGLLTGLGFLAGPRIAANDAAMSGAPGAVRGQREMQIPFGDDNKKSNRNNDSDGNGGDNRNSYNSTGSGAGFWERRGDGRPKAVFGTLAENGFRRSTETFATKCRIAFSSPSSNLTLNFPSSSTRAPDSSPLATDLSKILRTT